VTTITTSAGPAVCDVTTVRGTEGEDAMAGNGCGPDGAASRGPITVTSVIAASDGVAVVSGVTGANVATLIFAKQEGGSESVALRARPNQSRRSFSFSIPRTQEGSIVGRAADGRELGRATVPVLPPGTPAVFPSPR
jgi:hypothetical protein